MIFKIINEQELKNFIEDTENDLQTKEGVEDFLEDYTRYIKRAVKKEDGFTVYFEGYAFCTVSFFIKREFIPENYLRELTKKAEEE